jgi:tetratricopeptide (TPR) repeat protein
MGHKEEAIASYERAIAIQPQDISALYDQGLTLYELCRYSEAIASYTKALRLQPNTAIFWYNIACCYALQSQVEQAIENLQQAINLSPEKYRALASNSSIFAKIRQHKRFGSAK